MRIMSEPQRAPCQRTMISLANLLLLTVLMLSACSDPPPRTVLVLTVGKSEEWMAKNFKDNCAITVDGKQVHIRKTGLSNNLIGDQDLDLDKNNTFTTADHHHHVIYRLFIHESGDVIVTYQVHHTPPGMKEEDVDSGTVILPKSSLARP